MFDGDKVHRGVEGCRAEGQRREIGERIDLAVIPRRVAHREIDTRVALAREMMPVLPFARARIQHARTVRQGAREGRHGVFDLAFEVQDVPPQRPRQPIGDCRVAHGRASWAMPEPDRPYSRRGDAEIDPLRIEACLTVAGRPRPPTTPRAYRTPKEAPTCAQGRWRQPTSLRFLRVLRF